jgi:hypothetical protein
MHVVCCVATRIHIVCFREAFSIVLRHISRGEEKRQDTCFQNNLRHCLIIVQDSDQK